MGASASAALNIDMSCAFINNNCLSGVNRLRHYFQSDVGHKKQQCQHQFERSYILKRDAAYVAFTDRKYFRVGSDYYAAKESNANNRQQVNPDPNYCTPAEKLGQDTGRNH
jgi:hypothetical protein